MSVLPNLLALAVLALAPFAEPSTAAAQPKGCPPGLAKKGVVPDQELHRDRTGTIARQGDLIFLDDYRRYDLSRLPYGQRYAVVDNRIVVIDRESYEILQLIRVFRTLID